MPVPAWKDITSYSRGADRTPRTWELRTATLRITVTRHIHYEPDQWLMNCPELSLENQVLKNKNLEEAQAEALRSIRQYISALNTELRQLMLTLELEEP